MIKGSIYSFSKKDDLRYLHTLWFDVGDIYMVMRENGMVDYAILDLDPYEFSNDASKIKEELDGLLENKIFNSVIVLMEAYLFKKNLPRVKNHCEVVGKDCIFKDGGMELPFDEVLNRHIEILESAGLVNITSCGTRLFKYLFGQEMKPVRI